MDDDTAVRRWSAKHGLTEPIAKATGNVLTALGADGVPSTALLVGGRVRAVASEGVSSDDLTWALQQWR